MKKTYNQPESIIVEFGTLQMMAESLPIGGSGGGDEIDNPGQILTKEDKSAGKGIWDNEW